MQIEHSNEIDLIRETLAGGIHRRLIGWLRPIAVQSMWWSFHTSRTRQMPKT